MRSDSWQSGFWRKRGVSALGMVAFGLALTLLLQQVFSTPALAATYVVSRFDDPAPNGCASGTDCSLREAILAANTSPGPDTITLGAGTYLLEIEGIYEEAGETGDLDIYDDLIINGAGQDVTIIESNNLDRVLHVHTGTVILNDVTIRYGYAEDDTGGGIKNSGVLTINNSTIYDNWARWGGGIHNSVYSVIDSRTSGGPTYSFVDISGGTPLDLDNDEKFSVVQDIGFDFVFYGNRYPFVYITSDGFLRFVDDLLFDPGNDPLPHADETYNTIAPFWDDLNPTSGGVYAATIGVAPNRTFIVQYDNVKVEFNDTEFYVTFQVILKETTNEILFQYEDVEDSDIEQGHNATIGIAGPEDRLDAVQYSYNKNVLTNGLAILFTPSAGRLFLNRVTIDSNGAGLATFPFFYSIDVEGAGLYNNGTAHIVDSVVQNNRELGEWGLNGAGIANRGGTVYVTRTLVYSNVASNNGGGISNRYGYFSLVDSDVIENVVKCYNDQPTGGGISNRYGTMFIDGTEIISNSLQDPNNTGCNGSGGGLDTFFGTVTIEDSTIAQNAILLGLAPSCCPGASGGGIQAIMSHMVITGSDILTNSTGFSRSTGAGIDLIKSSLIISYSRIVSNTNPSPTDDFDSQGGGIRADQSTLEIYNTEIRNNVAVGGGGGGIAHFTPPSYTVIDSKSPLGPIYNFEDISTGEADPLNLGDSDAAEVNIGFPFRFYGEEYESVYIGSNGYLSFNNGNPNDFFPDSSLPDFPFSYPCSDYDVAPNLAIFAFADDLDPESGGQIYVQTLGSAPNRRFIVQYHEIPFYDDPDAGTVTFQVILYEGSNEIKIQYEDVEDSERSRGRDAFVMVESADNAPGSDGESFPDDPVHYVEVTQYHECDTETTRLSNGLAVLFRPIGDLIVQESVISSNRAGTSGGGLFHYGYFSGAVGFLLNSILSANLAPTGTEFYDEHGTLTLVETGEVVLRKVTEPAGGTGFTVTSGITDPVVLNDGDIITLTGIPSGTHDFTEQLPSNWDLIDLVCTEPFPDSTVNVDQRRATVRVETGETVTCTFTNRQRGQLIVAKQTVPIGGTGFEFTRDFGAPFTVDDGALFIAYPVSGTYAVSESVRAGWNLVDLQCSDPTGDTTSDLATGRVRYAIAPGETVICTFRNEQVGTVVVEKVTDPAGGTGFEFTGDLGNFTLDDGQSIRHEDLLSGTYSVSESVADGWTLSSATCSNGSAPDAIVLEAGAVVTCTFVNSNPNLAGQLVLVKDTVPDDATANWLFDVSGPTSYQEAISGDGRVTTTVAAGTYTIVESAGADTNLDEYATSYACVTVGGGDGPSGSGSTAADVEVGAGETVVCTFTNISASLAGQLVLVKDTEPDDATANWLFDVSGPTSYQEAISGDGRVTTTVAAGTYTIVESAGAATNLDEYTTSYACVTVGGGDGPSGSGAIAADVEVGAGTTVVCTFTNERRPASIAVSKTVGTDPNVCATTTAISTTASTTVYFCITLHNTGQIPLHTHLIEDPTLGLSESVVAELAPNTSRSFTHNDFAELAVLVTEDLVNNATVTSSSAVSDAVSSEAEPVTATSVGTATVDVTDPTNDDPTNEPDLPNKLHLPLIGNE